MNSIEIEDMEELANYLINNDDNSGCYLNISSEVMQMDNDMQHEVYVVLVSEIISKLNDKFDKCLDKLYEYMGKLHIKVKISDVDDVLYDNDELREIMSNKYCMVKFGLEERVGGKDYLVVLNYRNIEHSQMSEYYSLLKFGEEIKKISFVERC